MATDSPVISSDLFRAFLHCEHKSHLRLLGCAGDKCEFEQLQDRLDAMFHAQACSHVASRCRADDVLFALGTAPPRPSLVDIEVVLDAIIEKTDFGAPSMLSAVGPLIQRTAHPTTNHCSIVVHNPPDKTS